MRSHVPMFVACLSVCTLGCSGKVADPTIDKDGEPSDEGGGGGVDDRLTDGPAPPDDAEVDCNGSDLAVGTARWRRLTRAQYTATVSDLLGVQPDTSGFLSDTPTGVFATNTELPPTDADIDAYRSTAEAVSGKALGNLKTLLPCDPATKGQDACATQFISSFGQRAFRRPLTPDEKTTFETLFNVGKTEGFDQGIALVLEAVLQSPSFLYLTEYGNGKGAIKKLTSHELAQRLSYSFWNTMPDAALTTAAADGKLETPEQVAGQAKRMMDDPRFGRSAGSFFAQLLGVSNLGKLGAVSKQGEAEFDEAMRAAMQQETETFVTRVLADDDGSLSTLFTAKYSYPTGPLLKLYGAATFSSQ